MMFEEESRVNSVEQRLFSNIGQVLIIFWAVPALGLESKRPQNVNGLPTTPGLLFANSQHSQTISPSPFQPTGDFILRMLLSAPGGIFNFDS